MENSILFTTSILSVSYNGEIMIGNLFFYLLLLGFLIFPLGIFFVTRYFKKKMALNQENLFGKISLLEDQYKFLLKEQNARSSELAALKKQVAEIENKLNQWIEEKS
jgi:Tfp pilus assembly protein PilO